MLDVTLRSWRRKIAKLFKTSLATRRYLLPGDLFRLSWCIAPLSNIVIRFAYVHVSLSMLVVWGGPGDWNTIRAISQQVGRALWVSAPRGIMFPMVQQVARETQEEDTFTIVESEFPCYCIRRDKTGVIPTLLLIHMFVICRVTCHCDEKNAQKIFLR